MKTKPLSASTVDSIILAVEKNLRETHNRQISLTEDMKKELRTVVARGSLETEKNPIDQEKIAAQISNYISMNMREDALAAPKKTSTLDRLFGRGAPQNTPATISRASMAQFDANDLQTLCSEVSQVALKKEDLQNRQEAAAVKIQSAFRQKQARKVVAEKRGERDRKLEEQVVQERTEAARIIQRAGRVYNAKKEVARRQEVQAERVRQEAALKAAAEAERKQKEEATDKAKSPAPLLIKWHEPGPRDLLRPDPTIARLEAQREAALKAAEEAAKKKETGPAKTTDDLPTKPKNTAPELGSARDSQEMAALHHADAVFAAAQKDHVVRQEAADRAVREEAVRELERTLAAKLRTEIKAAKNPSWLSRTGEFHVERDKLAEIMAKKIATKIHDNPDIPSAYISGHAEEISRTTVETMRTKTMAGTADPDAREPQDKTYKQLSEEFLEHRKNVADINEVLTGPRASGRGFDDKLAEATSAVVVEKAKQTLQQRHGKNTGRAR